jgi:uncharacterized membrane protein YgcG
VLAAVPLQHRSAGASITQRLCLFIFAASLWRRRRLLLRRLAARHLLLVRRQGLWLRQAWRCSFHHRSSGRQSSRAGPGSNAGGCSSWHRHQGV